LVLLAAGLDTRAFRLAWPPGVTVFELDQPQVIEFKDEVLRREGAQPACVRIAVGTDLREDWQKQLRDAGLDPALPTAWVAEGLLACLPPDAEESLLRQIHDLSAPDSRIAMDRIRAVESAPLDEIGDRSGVDMASLINT
jgi:methyltransferase (TIGR00027 family)